MSKTLGNNGGWKVNMFRSRLYPWKCSVGFEGGFPWRWIAGRLGPEESFKDRNSSGARSAGIMEVAGWGRVLDLVHEIFD